MCTVLFVLGFPSVVVKVIQTNYFRFKHFLRKKMFSITSLIISTVLFLNSITILNEKRFLEKRMPFPPFISLFLLLSKIKKNYRRVFNGK